MSADDPLGRLQDAERKARAREALTRTEMTHRTADPASEPAAPASTVGEPLACGQSDAAPSWFLQGRELRLGDVIDVYTHGATGWLRGSFEPTQKPLLLVSLRDPRGTRGADGQFPSVGELAFEIPRRAVCRWP
jgi:hypothetical protein